MSAVKVRLLVATRGAKYGDEVYVPEETAVDLVANQKATRVEAPTKASLKKPQSNED